MLQTKQRLRDCCGVTWSTFGGAEQQLQAAAAQQEAEQARAPALSF